MPVTDTRAARWVGLGNSRATEPATAGREAAHQALAGRTAKCLIVFASPDYDLAELARSIHGSAAGADVVGCSTAGEIATDGPGDASVVVMALGGEGLSVATAAPGEASSACARPAPRSRPASRGWRSG